jgi:tetratricopeptide (TPR) repeat protein
MESEAQTQKGQLYDDLLFPEDHSNTAIEEERSYVFETRLETANKRRREGNEVLKETGDISKAICLWKKALYHAEFDEMSYNYELMEQHRKMVDDTLLPIYLNMAMVQLKEGVNHDPIAVCKHCSDALKIAPENSKALFRRGQAWILRNELDKAKADMLKAAKLQPKDKSLRAALEQIRDLQKQNREEQKKQWGGLLSKNSSKTAAIKDDSIKQPTSKPTVEFSSSPTSRSVSNIKPTQNFSTRVRAALFSWPVAVALIAVFAAYACTRKDILPLNPEL